MAQSRSGELAARDPRPRGAAGGPAADEDARLAPLLIDGADRWASDGGRFERRNPLTDAIVSVAAAATLEDVRDAAGAAARAFPEWSASGPGVRRRLLLAAADGLTARKADFVAAMADETGATADWASDNVSLASDMLRDAAMMTTQIAGATIPSDRPGVTAFALRRPVGVVAAIAPWNAPVVLAVRAIAAPLACGNTVALKTSELCPATQRLVGDVMQAAGFPRGVVNLISNAPRTPRAWSRRSSPIRPSAE